MTLTVSRCSSSCSITALSKAQGRNMGWRRAHRPRWRQFNKEKGKAAHESKGKQKGLFSTSHQQVISSQCLGNRTLVSIVDSLGNKHLNDKCTSSFFFLLVLLLSTMLFGMEYLLDQLESAVLALFSPSLLPTLSILAFRGGGWGGMLERQPWCCGNCL